MPKITHITVYEPENNIVIYRGNTSKLYKSVGPSSVERLSELLYTMGVYHKAYHKVFLNIHDYKVL